MAHEMPRMVQTILIGAAQIIRTRGWCRGTLLDERGAVCLLSAIYVASTGRPAAAFYGEPEHEALTVAAWGVVEELINARCESQGEGKLTIPGWNDLPARTVEDVIAVLDDAAAVTALS